MEVELPNSPLFTRLFAESPWTLALPLLLVAAGLAWWGARREQVKPILAGVAMLLAAAGVLAIAAMRTSPGEHAAATVRALVAAAESADMQAFGSLFAEDASMHYGGPQAPGDDMTTFLRAAQSLAGRHRIESNTITELDYSTADDSTGAVLLGCRTETASGYGPIPTRWYFRVHQSPDGRWLIEQIAWLKMANQQPSRNF